MTDESKPAAKPAATKTKQKSKMAVAEPKRKPALPAIPRNETVENVKETLAVSAAELRKAAPEISRKLLAAALDESHPLHEKAILMIGERLWPVRSYAASGIAQVGGIDGRGTSMPNVVINIVEAQAPRQVPAAIEVRAIPDEAEEE